MYGSPGVVDIGDPWIGGIKLILGGYSDTGISDAVLGFDGKDWFIVDLKMKYPRAVFPMLTLK